MRQSKFTEEKIIAVLAEQERGMGSAEVSRRRKQPVRTLALFNGSLIHPGK
ncbi:MAG: hypothetical protein J2P49_05455 [Methylocapsa sp.]|nr:hypothetical protein [Methylocapsa sp.]